MQNLMMIYLKTILRQSNCLELHKPITIDGTVSSCSIIPAVHTRNLSSMKDIYPTNYYPIFITVSYGRAFNSASIDINNLYF